MFASLTGKFEGTPHTTLSEGVSKVMADKEFIVRFEGHEIPFDPTRKFNDGDFITVYPLKVATGGVRGVGPGCPVCLSTEFMEWSSSTDTATCRDCGHTCRVRETRFMCK